MTPVRPARILPYGPAAALAEFDTGTTSTVITRWAERVAGLNGVDEVVPAARTVLVVGPAAAAVSLSEIAVEPAEQRVETEVVDIPVRYDGDDLEDVARLTGLSADEVVAAHSTPIYRCAFCGFAPGFSYLEGLDGRLVLPRRESPRVRVPAGAVAIADHYSAVYPSSSPGGWHLLGHTDLTMFDLEDDPPARVPPGMQVRFVAR
jgi:KipI family sensor histidine kinase inhibitor